MRSNVVAIRIPSLEMEILGNKIHIDTGPLNASSECQLSDGEARTLRMVMLVLSRLAGVTSN